MVRYETNAIRVMRAVMTKKYLLPWGARIPSNTKATVATPIPIVPIASQTVSILPLLFVAERRPKAPAHVRRCRAFYVSFTVASAGLSSLSFLAHRQLSLAREHKILRYRSGLSKRVD